jgi:hypothetical protein
MASLSDWAASVALPDSGSGARRAKVAFAGMGTAAAIGFTVGGPAGWLLGGVIGLIASALADHVSDSVENRQELKARVEEHARKAFDTFAKDAANAIASAGTRLDRRVRDRMQPFLADMEQRLESIREPTPEELALHEEMRRTTTDSLDLLLHLLGEPAHEHARVPPNEAA